MEEDELEDDVVLISAIEHYSYCPRQCALIHIEQTWDENLHTVRGRHVHERVDAGQDDRSDGVAVLRGLPLWSERLRLRGKADVVELRPQGPFPVEYKSGRRRAEHADLQLCAQALCLEEMFGVAVERGAVFYAASRSRHEVRFTDALRVRTMAIVDAIRQVLRSERLPPPVNDRRCLRCSLVDSCLPGALAERRRLGGLQGALYIPLAEAASDA